MRARPGSGLLAALTLLVRTGVASSGCINFYMSLAAHVHRFCCDQFLHRYAHAMAVGAVDACLDCNAAYWALADVPADSIDVRV